MSLLLVVVFFLSGAAALLFETLWFHQAGLALGNSVWASSLVLAAFMGGLGLGNALAAGMGRRVRRPLRLYALVELLIGATGVALVFVLPLVTPLLADLLRPLMDSPWLLNPVRIVLSFALLMVPATAMGVTLPLLVTALSGPDSRFGTVLGRLYGWNTLGAVFGAIAGPTLLILVFGIRGSAFIAFAMNGIAAAVALGIDARTAAEPRPAPAQAGAPLAGGWILAAAFVSGALLLGLEVVWFRFLLLFVIGTDIAFALMLAVVLTGIGLGGLAGGRWLALRRDGAGDAAVLALSGGILCIALYAGFETALSRYPADPLMLGLALMLPVALVSGALFTLLGEALHRVTGEAMRSAGLLTFANTAGAMLGPLLAGFLLLPTLGIERSLRLLGAAYAVVGLLVIVAGVRPAGPRVRGLTALAFLALMLMAALLPFGAMERQYIPRVIERASRGEPYELVEVREGLTETIIYLRQMAFGEPIAHRMVTNGHSMAGTTITARRYMRLYVWWPAAVHPELNKALLISYGVGTTAKALTDTASLETIDVVDISRDVLEMNRIVYPRPETHPLNDPRVRVHVEDGRYFLQTTNERFDLITAEPPPPKMAGVVNLYTREYFELVRSRLAEGGMTTYWLPVHTLLPSDTRTIIRAFCDAFDDCTLWGGAALNWMLVGTRNAEGPVSVEHFERQWNDPVVGPQLRQSGLGRPELMGTLFMAGPDDLDRLTGGTPPLTDDRPKRLSEVSPSGLRLNDVYSPLMDTAATIARFEQSELVSRLWPPDLKRRTARFFDVQAIVNRVMLMQPTTREANLEEIDRLLSDPALGGMALWAMGTGALRAELAARAYGRGERSPEIDFQRGLLALAEGRDAEAAALLAGPLRTPDRGPDAAIYSVYALCRGGDAEAGRALLKQMKVSAEIRYLLYEHCHASDERPGE